VLLVLVLLVLQALLALLGALLEQGDSASEGSRYSCCTRRIERRLS
jgi:hypothetical protein